MKDFKNIQYSPPTGIYKVSPKNKLNWKQYNNARLQVSVGNLNSEDQKLYATIEWLLNRFDNVEIIVSDTLQRWNLIYKENINQKNAHDISLNLGSDWLERNKNILSQPEKIKITRWDDLINDSNFLSAKKLLDKLALENKDFLISLENTTKNFWKRNWTSENFSKQDYEKFKHHSLEFLIEELSVFSFLCRNNTVDIYAGSWLTGIFTTLRSIKNKDLKYFDQDWLQIDFVKNKGYVDKQKAA
jgi:tRNA-dependent cyclodipeptide synthase